MRLSLWLESFWRQKAGVKIVIVIVIWLGRFEIATAEKRKLALDDQSGHNFT